MVAVTEYHAMSFRINGTTYDLDGVDKASLSESDVVRAVRWLVSDVRGDNRGPNWPMPDWARPEDR